MAADQYIFEDAAAAEELRRLRLLESAFDEKSRRWLLAAGELTGFRCLEVGAGAGSIAAWLAERVGPTGGVTAIDTNTRFLAHLPEAVRVIEGAVEATPLPARSFDRIHARYVLIHNADAQKVLDALLAALAPGGVLLLEEPDFSAAAALAGPPPLRGSFERVREAIRALFANRSMNYAFGRTLPQLLVGTSLLGIDYDCHAERGTATIAEMMRLSILGLREKYVATGQVDDEDIDRYAEFASSADCWGVYYATVRVLARRSA